MGVSRATAATLRALEERLLNPGVRKDAQVAGDLIASDFVEIGKSGNVFDKTQVLHAMASEPREAALAVKDFKARGLAPTVVLVTYRCHRVLRSSIWRKVGDRWQILFHQGTPAS